MKALEDTKRKLEEKNQMIKYRMMRHFTYMLAFVFIAGAASIFGEIYLKTSRTAHD
jgi:H+/Cl- antiporter ClcA